ncbi:MAG: 4a-hydroxytetrahydrobiopterin dehydratase [Dehalococcoidia bacterium]|nr:4a-hydroxytetrahydrobiopterin dehydratase [Dehalococcoidia bacterium]
MAKRDRLSDSAIADALAGLDGWRREADGITRAFEFRDFSEAFGFLARAALLQERADHHANVESVYNRVRLTLTTHDAGGITAMDIDLAKAIDALLR